MTAREHPLVTSTAVQAEIRIYSYQNQILVGSITNSFLEETRYFRDVIEMAAILERIYDRLSFPQPTQSYRSFRPSAGKRKKYAAQLKAGDGFMNFVPSELENAKDKASFVVHVQFRQHATWQGNITWVDKGVTQQFRSVLEMIRLMTEAVESGDPDQTGFALPMEKDPDK
ncbi:MAG: hypothetical protein ACOX6P_08865 [Candidatus Merdivicinus sp.]|jgi:hypothetical protein